MRQLAGRSAGFLTALISRWSSRALSAAMALFSRIHTGHSMYLPTQKASRLVGFSCAVIVSCVMRHRQAGPWSVSSTSKPAGHSMSFAVILTPAKCRDDGGYSALQHLLCHRHGLLAAFAAAGLLGAAQGCLGHQTAAAVTGVPEARPTQGADEVPLILVQALAQHEVMAQRGHFFVQLGDLLPQLLLLHSRPRRSFSGCLHSVAWWAQTDDPAQ